MIKDKEGILSRWAEHSSELLNRVNPTDPSFIDTVPQLNVVEELDLPPTLDEVKKAIFSLKCRKAAGLDGLQRELLKYGGDRVHEEIINHMHAGMRTRYLLRFIEHVSESLLPELQCGFSQGEFHD